MRRFLQAIQFQIVDAHSRLMGARLLVRSAAQQVDARAVTRGSEVALAKQFATETAVEVASEAGTLMGGAGMLAEHPLERIVRDLRVHTVVSAMA
jgi:alkylation response protein AidB-like acyl-CoA dehydrogenase